jgi:hypothetical protein
MAVSVQCSRESTCTATGLLQRKKNNSDSTHFCVQTRRHGTPRDTRSADRHNANAKFFISVRICIKVFAPRRNDDGMRLFISFSFLLLARLVLRPTLLRSVSHARKSKPWPLRHGEKKLYTERICSRVFQPTKRKSRESVPTDSQSDLSGERAQRLAVCRASA